MTQKEQKRWKTNNIYNFMKRLILAPLLITLLLTSCSYSKKYKSYYEAKKACDDWTFKGGKYFRSGLIKDFLGREKYIYEDLKFRQCFKEEETNQIIGFEDTSLPKKSIRIELSEDLPSDKGLIKDLKRRFYY